MIFFNIIILNFTIIFNFTTYFSIFGFLQQVIFYFLQFHLQLLLHANLSLDVVVLIFIIIITKFNLNDIINYLKIIVFN